jgi:putative DNA primase/helicase
MKNESRLTHDQLKKVLPAGTMVGKEYETQCPLCFHTHLRLFDADGVKCENGCDTGAVIAHLRAKIAQVEKPKKLKPSQLPDWKGFTLAEYCDAKRLSELALMFYFEAFESEHSGKPVVGFPYKDSSGKVLATKIRLSYDSHDTYFLPKDPHIPYGSWRFTNREDPAGNWPKDIVICEGESDTQTLAFHSIPALGISGSQGWRTDYAQLPAIKNAERIFIVQESDDAGTKFVARVGKDLPREKAFALKLPEKDPSELHIILTERREIGDQTAPTFKEAFDAAIAEAQPFDTSSKKTETEAFRYPATDMGNAERMTAQHGEDIRCVTDELKFAVWDGTVWRKDQHPKILQPLAKKVVRTITPETTILERKEDARWGRASEALPRITALIGALWNEQSLKINSGEFDQHLMLLNTQNCTINLENQTPLDFRREDYLTKQAPVMYDKNARCPKFDAYLKRTFVGDKDVIHWITKALGYTLTGEIGEQCFFICLGPGGTGKSTLLDLVGRLMGDDYFMSGDFSAFVKSAGKFSSNQSYEIASYAGARFVYATEPEKGGTFEESLLKRLSGGEEVKSRMIYQAPSRFYPQLKLWFSMNHRPIIDGSDDAILRRLLIIPFDNAVSEIDRNQNQNLARKLFEEEGPGILNCLLNGLHDWCAEGLKKDQLPSAIAKATGEYRMNNHLIENFFAKWTTVGDMNQWERGGHLYAAYAVWANERNIHPLDRKGFKAELESRKCARKRGSGEEKGDGFIWYGIRLVDGYRQKAIEAYKAQPEDAADEAVESVI